MAKPRLLFIAILLSLSITIINSAIINVSTVSALKTAFKNVNPGDTINLAANTEFACGSKCLLSRNGTATQRITITGSASSVLTCTSIQTGYVLHLNGASYITMQGFTMKRSKKGIVIDQGNYNILDGVTVSEIGEEAVHFRDASNHNIIKNSFIYNTGLLNPEYGEGVYVGSDIGKWEEMDPKCDNNIIESNVIGPDVRAESIDIKEGSTGTIVNANIFNASGILGRNSADSWMDVKGDNCIVSNNIGYQAGAIPPQFVAGIQTHQRASGWGFGNVFEGNTGYFNSDFTGYLIDVTNQNVDKPNVVKTSNVVVGGGVVTNIPQTA